VDEELGRRDGRQGRLCDPERGRQLLAEKVPPGHVPLSLLK
jgi:hypothetical protein